MPQKRSSSKRKSEESVEKICHQLSSCELDSSGTSYTSSGSRGSLCCTRKHKKGDKERSPCRDPEATSESESRSRSSYSSGTESCSLSEEEGSEGRGGKTSKEQGS
jgi:hypothetical protein